MWMLNVKDEIFPSDTNFTTNSQQRWKLKTKPFAMIYCCGAPNYSYIFCLISLSPDFSILTHAHTRNHSHLCAHSWIFQWAPRKTCQGAENHSKKKPFLPWKKFECNGKLSAEVDGSVNLFKVFETLETTIDLFYAITLSPIIKRQAFNQHRPANAMCFGVWKSTRNVNIVFTHYHVWQNW